MAIASPAAPSSANLSGDIQQLQVWAKQVDNTLQSLNLIVTRLSNLLTQIIKLNNLKQPQ